MLVPVLLKEGMSVSFKKWERGDGDHERFMDLTAFWSLASELRATSHTGWSFETLQAS